MTGELVLFVQLPPPRFSFHEAPVNIPLAAGFMIAAMVPEKPPAFQCAILPDSTSDVYADAGLLDAIVQMRPSVLAMTLYVWNAQRSLFAASRAKELLPGLKVLIGGPEVTPDNEWLCNHPCVDAGVFGEGESRIEAVINVLLGWQTPQDIPGTFLREGTSVRLNPDPAEPWDLSRGRDPYGAGIIWPSASGTVFVETLRGCPFRCRYCYYHKAFGGVRSHPWPLIRRTLEWAYGDDSPVRELYLMDPSFNASPHYRELLSLLAELRSRKDIAIHTELRGDLIHERDVELLAAAGLTSAEVGLQSTNPKALALAGRTGDPDATARGVSLLKAADIDVTTGIIVGLPGDTRKDFARTLDWLKRTECYSVVHPFLLSVLPGTDFRAQADPLGLDYDPRPPYFVRSTPTFSEDEMHEAMVSCEEVFDVELDHIDLPSLVDSGTGVIAHAAAARYVSKWIVNPERCPWEQKLPTIVHMATDPFIFWFRGIDASASEAAALRIVSEFCRANPHAVLHMVFEYTSPPRLRFLEHMLSETANPLIYVNKSLQAWARDAGVVSPAFTIILSDPLDPGMRDEIVGEYGGLATVVWDIGHPDEEIIMRSGTPLLVSGPLNLAGPYGQHLWKALKTYHADAQDEVFFRDRRLQGVWSRVVLQRTDEYMPESIVVDL